MSDEKKLILKLLGGDVYNHRQRVSAAEPFRFGAIGAKFSDQSGNRLFAPYRKPSGRSVPLSFNYF